MSIVVQRVVVQRPPLKRALFRLHWIAGLTAGLVLAVVGFTGGLIGCEDWALEWLNPQLQISASGRDPLPPDRWIAQAGEAYPERSVRSVTWAGADSPVHLRMAREGDRGIEVALDPYDGNVLGMPRGAAFFAGVEQIHRTLAAGPVGKQIVGASTAMMIIMIATGIYLRWPRRRHSVSSWLRPNLHAKGRGLLWQLHAVAGTWLLLFYLCASLTGLWWSYDFYRNAVNSIAGVPITARRAPPSATDKNKNPPIVSVGRVWTAFRAAAPEATRATFTPTSKANAPFEIRYQTASSAHERAWDTLKLDLATGNVVSRELYADQPRGRRFVSSLFPLHSGSFLGAQGRVLMAIAALLMPFFAITGVWLWLLRRRNELARFRFVRTAATDLLESNTCVS